MSYLHLNTHDRNNDMSMVGKYCYFILHIFHDYFCRRAAKQSIQGKQTISNSHEQIFIEYHVGSDLVTDLGCDWLIEIKSLKSLF